MGSRYFENTLDDYVGGPVQVDPEYFDRMITEFVNTIWQNVDPDTCATNRADLYVGQAGIAFMFLKLSESEPFAKKLDALNRADKLIKSAKKIAKSKMRSPTDRFSFLSGLAGIYAVSAVISNKLGVAEDVASDLAKFRSGFDECLPINATSTGCDEILVGRAGYLAAIYWLNENLQSQPFNKADILKICQVMVESGRQYSKEHHSRFPLMYHYHDSEYLGAAHGICAIFHMMLESPWFQSSGASGPNQFPNIPVDTFSDIKKSIDMFVDLQEADGNFPVRNGSHSDKRLVHWCHGAPGAVYLLAKAYLRFGDEKYLDACRRAGDLVWRQGLLLKGPGICHGVAGNGYVHLLLYRLTQDARYLHRANAFARFIATDQFRRDADQPDRPFSLYEGLAGTVCFLLDLLQPQQASFPFMNVFAK